MELTPEPCVASTPIRSTVNDAVLQAAVPRQKVSLLERSKIFAPASDALRVRYGPHPPSDPSRVIFHAGKPSESAPGTCLAKISVPYIFDQAKNGMEDSRDLTISAGDVIANEFEIHAPIGNGSFSAVFSAKSQTHGRAVSVKILNNDKETFDAGLGEVRILAMIAKADPHNEHALLRMLDFFYYREHLFIVSELLHSTLLAHYSQLDQLGETARLSFYNAATLGKMARQILEALQFLHELGVTHCDIKTANICIAERDGTTFKLIDFGSATLVHDTHPSYLQSRWYRAPEVAVGDLWDEKVDIWSVGCCVAEVLLGFAAFMFDSMSLVLAAQKAMRGPFSPRMLACPLAPMFLTTAGVPYEVDPKGVPKGVYLIESLPDSSLRAVLTRQIAPSREAFGASHVDGCISFVQSLLTLDPVERPTAAAALRSPFLEPLANTRASSGASTLTSVVDATF